MPFITPSNILSITGLTISFILPHQVYIGYFHPLGNHSRLANRLPLLHFLKFPLCFLEQFTTTPRILSLHSLRKYLQIIYIFICNEIILDGVLWLSRQCKGVYIRLF
jgi:hypothetical protein